MPQTKCNTFFSQIRSVPNFLRDICTSPPPPTTPTISPCCQNPFSLLKATGWFLADKCATFKIQLYHILFVCLSLCYVLHTFSQQSDNIVIARKNGWTSLFLSQSHWHPFILHWNNSIDFIVLVLTWYWYKQEKNKVLFLFFISYVQLMSETLQRAGLCWETWQKSTLLSEDKTRVYQQEISKAINMQEDPHLISANFYFPNRH